MIENLLGRHAKFSASRRDFEPAGFVAVVTLCEGFAVDEDEIGIVGEVHRGMITIAL